VLLRSDAVLAVLRYVGGPWRHLALVLGWCPRPLRDLAYRFIARIRRSIPGITQPCPLPSPGQRSRMLGEGSDRAP
jgi:predicted DCC family thiol-disulfide oxidoreductase YuxK